MERISATASKYWNKGLQSPKYVSQNEKFTRKLSSGRKWKIVMVWKIIKAGFYLGNNSPNWTDAAKLFDYCNVIILCIHPSWINTFDEKNDTLK